MTGKRIEVADDDRLSPSFYNCRSRVRHANEEERLVYFFDYKTRKEDSALTNAGENDPCLGGGEVIDWKVLRKLKQGNKWGTLRHPMLLNFVNEKLLECALIYTVHIAIFAFFLLLLSYHIFQPSMGTTWLITLFVSFFTLMMLMKGTLKARIPENRVSGWFVISYSFNILTYAATFLYIWFPTLAGYDSYHQDYKALIGWFLPILAIISAWINFLYILRKSPYGIYIFMMVRILRSFGHIATIWIPTLVAFSFAFHLIMRDTGIEPWESVGKDTNSTVVQRLFIILQAVTKTSTMMIGEVDANDILGTKQWVPSILVLVFEIITVILLMNLMISLAVGDVSDLRNTAQDKLLKIRVNFVIEALQLSELFPVPYFTALHEKRTNNVLVIEKDGTYYTYLNENIDLREEAVQEGPSDKDSGIVGEKTYSVQFPNTMRMRLQPRRGRPHSLFFTNCAVNLVEATDSGIPAASETQEVAKDPYGWCRAYHKWIIGIDWTGYLDL